MGFIIKKYNTMMCLEQLEYNNLFMEFNIKQTLIDESFQDNR